MATLKVGLVLGGGGARGLAHIGVIKKLKDFGLPIDVITGASMGAIIGAAYAQTLNVQFIESSFQKFITSKEYQAVKGRAFDLNNRKPESFFHFISKIVKRRIIINLAANRVSLIQDRFLRNTLPQLLNDEPIEALKIPFACSALDLVSGKEKLFQRGSVLNAVRASASIPGFLPPVKDGERRLVDGAAIDNFPIKAAKKLGAEFIIICDVSPELEDEPPLNNVIDIFIRTHHAAITRLNELLIKEADIVLKPEISGINWTEFDQIDTLIKQGETVVEKNIQQIKKRYAQMNYPWNRIKRRIKRQ